MPKLRLSTAHDNRIFWPAKCVVCSSPSTTTLRARCSMVTSASYAILYWSWRSKRLSVGYPICIKHKILCFLPSRLSERNLFNTGVSLILLIAVFVLSIWLLAPIILFFFDGSTVHYDQTAFYYMGLIAAIVTVFFLVRKLTPVKLHGADDQSISLSISNENYATEFKTMNQKAILEEKK